MLLIKGIQVSKGNGSIRSYRIPPEGEKMPVLRSTKQHKMDLKIYYWCLKNEAIDIMTKNNPPKVVSDMLDCYDINYKYLHFLNADSYKCQRGWFDKSGWTLSWHHRLYSSFRDKGL